MALVASPLAQQLKELRVVLEEEGPPEYNLHTIETLATATKSLPSLKLLDYINYDFKSDYGCLDANVLEKMLVMTPALTNLDLGPFLFELVSNLNW
jgi:hypothetical protein